MRAPGRTSEVVTSRTVTRAALAGAATIVLVATTATVDPTTVRLSPAAQAVFPPVQPPEYTLFLERAERAASPPITRRGVARPVAHRAGSKPVTRHTPTRRAVRHRIHHRAAVAHAAPRRAAVARVRGSAGAVVGYARQQIGDPYVWGSDGPGSWDCSGLTRRSFAQAGVRLPRRAAAQSSRGQAVSRRAARAGDLVLWGGVGRAYHVGVYLGRGWVLHAPHPGKSVRAARLWGDPQFRRLL